MGGAARTVTAIDIGVVLVLQNLSIQTFMFALIKKSDLSAVQAMVEKKAQRQRTKQEWILAYRQTVPRSKAMAAKAMARHHLSLLHPG